jgi:nitrate reductase gamma subunit
MLISLLAVIALGVIAWLGTLLGLEYVFGVLLPLAAAAVFLAGFVWRIVDWAKSPVPFRIPTTGGQQRSLDWIKPARLDSPYTAVGTVGRMALEVLLFRSLFRNTKAELQEKPRLVYWSSKWLWLFALLFHYSFLVIFIRHFRLFMEPTPLIISAIEFLDGIMQIGVPRFFMTDAVVVAALLFLLARRLVDPKMRYISLPNDYFPLFLLLALVGSGIFLRYIGKTDIASVKVFTMGLVTLHPVLPKGISSLFFIHLFFLSALLVYFPFSKLMHMGGIFLSPTRNLPNNSRAVHHINPWNPPKTYRTYAEYEDEFRDLMDEAGLPLEITPEQAAAKE